MYVFGELEETQRSRHWISVLL